jgi:hypothetical protein
MVPSEVERRKQDAVTASERFRTEGVAGVDISTRRREELISRERALLHDCIVPFEALRHADPENRAPPEIQQGGQGNP